MRSRALVVASGSLVLPAAVGILLVTWFPQDSYGHPATTAGALHIAPAAIAALLNIGVTGCRRTRLPDRRAVGPRLR